MSINKRKFHGGSRTGKVEKKYHDPGLLAAVSLANYRLKSEKEAVRQMAVNKQVNELLTQHQDEIEDEFTDWMYGAFALALHRKYGFGAKRIATLFDVLQDLKNDLIDQGVNHEQIWDMVRDEIGLDVEVK